MMQPIAYVEFADGAMRPVFQDDHGQFVLADDGEPVYGIWQPVIVDETKNQPCTTGTAHRSM